MITMHQEAPRKPEQRRRSEIDIVALFVGTLLVAALFLACLQLLQVRTLILEGPQPDRAPLFEAGVLRSPDTLTMVCVLLAGLVGGYLQYMRERFNELDSAIRRRKNDSEDEAPPTTQSSGWFAFFSRLLMGLGAASVAALFIPLAIAERPSMNIYNPWGLLMLAAFSGYLSRYIFGDLQAKFEHLFEELKISGVKADTTEIGSIVAKNVIAALEPPPPINYHGLVAIDLIPATGGPTCIRTSEGVTFAELKPGKTYTLKVSFESLVDPEPETLLLSSDLGVKHQIIRMDGGLDLDRVPFEVRVETRFPNVARPTDRSIEVPRKGADRIEIPVEVPIPEDATLDPGQDQSIPPPREIAVFVYQKSSFCAATVIEVRPPFGL